MPTPAVNFLIRSDASYTAARNRFFEGVEETVSNIRILWTPDKNDTLTSREASPDASLFTWDGNVTSRRTKLGFGYSLSFDGSANYGTTPDRANLTFSTSDLTDQAFTIVMLANVTSTASFKDIITKWDVAGSKREWRLAKTNIDVFQFHLYDESTSQNPTRGTDAAVGLSAWHLFGVSYSGLGGALAMNGVTMYQDAVAVASTATNSGTYVATENGTALFEIGGRNGATNPFLGSLAFVLVCQANVSLSQHVALKSLVNQFFQMAL